jgi:radical SAM-linked protein
MRLRVRFTKLGKVRFTSHRDVARIWERSIRRAGLPVAYSQGFSPHARIAFGLALPTGAESLAEYLDIALDEAVDVDTMPAVLSGALPPGFVAVAAAEVEPHSESLQQAITSCSWELDAVGVDPDTVAAAVDRLLAADTIVVTRERKGKPVEDDLRPGILALEMVGAGPLGTRLRAELGARPRALRPSELLAALALPGDDVRVCRTHQWIQLSDARREPLPPSQLAGPARDDARDSRREPSDVRSRGQRPPDARTDERTDATDGGCSELRPDPALLAG